MTNTERDALAALVKQVAIRWGGPSMREFENDPPTRKHFAEADAVLAWMRENGYEKREPVECICYSTRSSRCGAHEEDDRRAQAAESPERQPVFLDEATVERAAQKMFEPDGEGGDYTWAEMVVEDPSRADIWRAEARTVLVAALTPDGQEGNR